jgi:hypothetical protein
MKLLFLILVIFLQGRPEYLHISNNGNNSEKCGGEQSPCLSFMYIFEERLVNSSNEKGVLIPDGYIFSYDNGYLRLINATPEYYIYGANYKSYTISRIYFPDDCGHIHCEHSVRFEYLEFISETGVFHDFDKVELALIYANVDGVRVNIINCSFTTGSNYVFETGSDTALLYVHNGVKLVMNHVNITKFNILNRNFIDIGDGYPNVEANFTSVKIWNVIAHDKSDIEGIIHLSNTSVRMQNCTFNESHGYGPAAFSFDKFL